MVESRDPAYFRVSPQVLGPLGAEQLQDPALAVLELIKNSWDADATSVTVRVDQESNRGVIAVFDNGHGMTRKEFVSRWLVIGASEKRQKGASEGGRPLIGEKGLGRLASFALAKQLEISSARKGDAGFRAEVNWENLLKAKSLDQYHIGISKIPNRKGTEVLLSDLRSEWTQQNTEYLTTHAELLTSVPGERFKVALVVNGKAHSIAEPFTAIEQLSEARMEVSIGRGGKPEVTSALVKGSNKTRASFRVMKPQEMDAKLEGVKIRLAFFLRLGSSKKLSDSIKQKHIDDSLERYHGIRIYRDGINVPPYGVNGDDWSGLERQRTATGGPTLVPGNSQLIGEVLIGKERHPQFVITAGRSGFSDQTTVKALAAYVRWAVRELGTARRAERLKIRNGDPIPSRVDADAPDAPQTPQEIVLAKLGELLATPAIKSDPPLSRLLKDASAAVKKAFGESEETLRLYAQLASTGIAATSFAHELRGEFDVVSEAVSELNELDGEVDSELIDLLTSAWRRITAFATLFKIVPIRSRRRPAWLSSSLLEKSANAILGLASPDKVKTEVKAASFTARLVAAEYDSIILNLITNAVKAIAESKNNKRGQIRLSLAAKGEDLRISVSDNGMGVSEAVAETMFEPHEGKFAEGTGLGLPIVKFISERYGGSVSLASDPPDGFVTEFRVMLRGVIAQ